MTRVRLSRLPGERVLVSEDATTCEVALADLPATCASASPTTRGGSGTTPPGGTPRCWLPACGSSVPRPAAVPRACCAGRPPLTRRCWAATSAELWDRLRPATVTEPVLFSGHDALDHLRADVEDARQLAAIDASPEAARLGLLLAAESAGALVAAEMTHAGLPWRVDVHEALLTERLGPRPPRGARPRSSRSAPTTYATPPRRPRPQPRLPARAAGRPAPRRARGRPTPGRRRCAPSTTRSSSRCCATRSSPTCSRPTAGRGSTSGSATAGSARSTSPPGRRPGGGRPTAAAPCRSRCRCGRRPWPTRAGCSSSPTWPSSSRACSPG